jgi:F0F1-type ATP synthase gamma subunit
MLDQGQLKTNFDFLETIRSLCVAYEQISVIKMKKIKDAVLYTRDFYDELSEIYLQMKKTYKHQVMTLARQNQIKDPEKLLLMGKNEKTVNILLSANNKLYGDILNRVFYKFVEEIKNQDNAELVIIGRLGKEMYEGLGLKKAYTYFEIPDTDLIVNDLKLVINNIISYSKINVFFGRYDSFFSQLPINKNITGDIIMGNDDNLKENKFYYFEPNLEKILLFFETQIFSNFFKQTAYESQLARYASRIAAMEQALGAIEKEEKITTNLKIKAHNNVMEQKQNERVAKIFLRKRN